MLRLVPQTASPSIPRASALRYNERSRPRLDTGQAHAIKFPYNGCERATIVYALLCVDPVDSDVHEVIVRVAVLRTSNVLDIVVAHLPKSPQETLLHQEEAMSIDLVFARQPVRVNADRLEMR